MSRSSFLIAAMLSIGLALPAAAQVSRTPSSSAEGDSDRRLQRLEEQIVDLSAQIGAVETMARGGGAPVAGGSSFSGGDDSARLSQLETQVRTMSSQITEVLRRLERMEARFGLSSPPSDTGARVGEAAPPPRSGGRAGSTRPAEFGTGFSVGGVEDPDSSPGSIFGSSEPSDGGSRRSAAAAPEPRTSGGWSTDAAPVSPAPAPLFSSRPAASDPAPVRTAALSPREAQTLYDQAFASLQQNNYRSATEGFEQFVQRYPSDPLAGPAHFYLGEAAYTSGEYRKAADSYLKSATNYPQNEKAAESMLKLGISLRRLGENDAACSAFGELAKRYPSAAAVLQRADIEKRRASC